MIPPLKKRSFALALGLLISIGAWLVVGVLLEIEWIKKFVDTLDGFAYDFLFITHQTPLDQLVIVDLKTSSDIVDREKCAKLIEGLQDVGAKIIGFDILFSIRLGNQGNDSLVSITQTCPNVIHAFNLIFREGGDNTQDAHLARHALRLRIMPSIYDCIPASDVQLPFSELFLTSKDMAHVNLVPDSDGAYRRFPLVLRYENEIYPGMPLQMIRRFRDVADEDFEIHFGQHECMKIHDNTFVKLKTSNEDSIDIPVDMLGQVLINYIKKFKIYPIDNALERISHSIDGEDFRDKMVLVVNSGNTRDYNNENPLNERIPNWVIHASVISQILNRQHITKSGSSTIFFTFTFAVIVLIWLIFGEIHFPRLKTQYLVVLVVVFLLMLATIAILLYMGNWLNLVLPSVIVCASYLSAKYYLNRTKPPVPSFLQYHDFELLIQKKTEFSYLVDVIRAPAGEEAEGEFSMRPDGLENILKKLRSFDISRAEVIELGKTLFNALFQPQIRRSYDESLGIIRNSEKDGLRIKLRIEPAELSALPWEFMYEPRRRGHLALSEKLSIARHPILPKEIQPLEVEPPLKILVLISSPSDLALLDVEKEKMRIATALKTLVKSRQVQLDFLENVMTEKVRSRLSQNYHVLHYIGHGDFIDSLRRPIQATNQRHLHYIGHNDFIDSKTRGEGCLVFENESGTSNLVNAETLGLLLTNTTIRLVILNACETAKSSNIDYFLGVAPMLMNAGIPAVIAMQFEIPDQSAIMFSEEFYSSLAKNYQVDAALSEARKVMAIRLGIEKIDWGIPVLFMRASDGILFRQKTV